MDHVKSALDAATNADALEFKNSIFAALQDKIQDALYLKKMEIGASLLKDKEDVEMETNSEQEENVDENL